MRRFDGERAPGRDGQGGRSEQSFRTLVERTTEAVFVHRDGRFVYVNPAAAWFLGFDHAEELMRHSVFEIVHPEDRGIAEQRIRSLLEGSEHMPTADLRLLRRDGATVVAEISCALVEFEGKEAIVVLARDMTERRRMEAQLAISDRMAALGTLSAGIAHEINNPMTYILANLTIAEQRIGEVLDADPNVSSASNQQLRDVQKVLAEAVGGAERVRKIVRDLRTFSRPEESARGPTEVATCLESSISMVWNEIRHRATLEREYDVGASVLASDGQLGQLFVNLLVNAAHAVPEGAADVQTIRVVLRGNAPEGVIVEVHDTGAGIPPEDVGRIFDPFFTTKPAGVGMGLGLFICQNIVRALGGTLSVTSQVGRGTTARVVLPRAEPAPAPPPRPPVLPRHGGKILVLDDEPMIGAGLKMALLEHNVLALTDPQEALRRVAAGERFDLVVCDLMMPVMTGMDFHAAVLAIDATQADRMVFVTGGAFTARARAFMDQYLDRCLEKPFHLDELRRFITQHMA